MKLTATTARPSCSGSAIVSTLPVSVATSWRTPRSTSPGDTRTAPRARFMRMPRRSARTGRSTGPSMASNRRFSAWNVQSTQPASKKRSTSRS